MQKTNSTSMKLEETNKDKNSLNPVNNQELLENNFQRFWEWNKGHKLS